MSALARLHELFPARSVDPIIDERPRWGHGELAGRLVELSGQGATASLTMTFGLLLDAQRRGETAAWVAAGSRLFYPPDAVESGVDLAALAVVRTDGAPAAARAADKLLRSGAFGLVILDLGRAMGRGATKAEPIPTPLLARLVKLAQKHDATVLCLTDKHAEAPSLGSLVSLRCEASRQRKAGVADRFTCELRVLKDKRRGPSWQHREVVRGPAGLA